MSGARLSARFERWLGAGGTRLVKRRAVLAVLIGYVFFAATYLPINEFSVGRPAHTLFLPGEAGLPFLPIFEYLYVITYFLPIALAWLVRDPAVFRQASHAALVVLAVAYATYLVFPVYFERPVLRVDSLPTWLLSLEYLDKSYNHFPSLHVAWTWLVVFAAQISRGSRIAFVTLALGISLSTLFVKQHYLVDVLYGFALAGAAWRATRSRA
jgi:membrane-associated phospholipid phosphatase